MIFRGLILLLLCTIEGTVFCQEISIPSNQKIQLEGHNIRLSKKDKYGTIWSATQDGLFFLNGTTHLEYNKDSKNANLRLDFVDIRFLYVDSTANELWVMGTEFGFNIIDLKTRKIKLRQPIDKLEATEWLITAEKIEDGFLIGTSNKLLLYNNITKKTTPVDLSIFNQSTYRINLIKKEKNDYWFTVDNVGIAILDNKEYKIRKYISTKDIGFNTREVKFLDLLFTKNSICIATNIGSRYCFYDSNLNLKIKSISKEFSNSINSCLLQIEKTIFIFGKINYSLNTENLQCIPLTDMYKNNFISEINAVEKIDSSLYLASSTVGLFYIKQANNFLNSVTDVTNQKPNAFDHLFSICEIKDNRILFASGQGLHSFKKGKIQNISTRNKFYFVGNLDRESIIASSPEGIFYGNNSQFNSVKNNFPEFTDFAKFEVNKIIKLTNNKYFLSTENENGVLIWDRENKKIKNIKIGDSAFEIASNTTNSSFLAKDSTVIMLSDYAITQFDFINDKSIIYHFGNDTNKVKLGLFFDIIEINNEYWIATYGTGLIILNKEFKIIKKINTSDGLCNNGVYKIFEKNGYVYVSSNNGVSIINTKTYKIKNLFKEDGLHGNAFEEACGYQTDSLIYLGGIDGYTIINPNNFKENKTPPKFYFQEINIETSKGKYDTTNLEIEKLQIPNNYTQVKINLHGINFQNPEKVNYWYRIREVGDNWIDLKTQNFIPLIGLSPGKYHLEVKSANEDGYESEPKTLVLHFLPKWYQTWLFKILVVLSIAGFLFALYKFRINQLKKILTVRQKISADLHDDVGATLSTINMYSQIAEKQNNNAEVMNEIKNNTQDVLEKLDEIVWATNPKNDDLEKIIERLDFYARPLFKQKNIEFELILIGDFKKQKIGELSRKNFYLIAKEALNNCAKYANAKNCTLIIEYKDGKLYGEIKDNGKGFDIKIPTNRNGILNMKIRAQEAKGECKITSEIEKGSSITFWVSK